MDMLAIILPGFIGAVFGYLLGFKTGKSKIKKE